MKLIFPVIKANLNQLVYDQFHNRIYCDYEVQILVLTQMWQPIYQRIGILTSRYLYIHG